MEHKVLTICLHLSWSWAACCASLHVGFIFLLCYLPCRGGEAYVSPWPLGAVSTWAKSPGRFNYSGQVSRFHHMKIKWTNKKHKSIMLQKLQQKQPLAPCSRLWQRIIHCIIHAIRHSWLHTAFLKGNPFSKEPQSLVTSNWQNVKGQKGWKYKKIKNK